MLPPVRAWALTLAVIGVVAPTPPAPCTAQPLDPPYFGLPRYAELASRPESFDSIATRYAALIEAKRWSLLLERIASDQLATEDWRGPGPERARRLFIATIDAFLASLPAARADSAYRARDAALVTDIAGSGEALARSKVNLFSEGIDARGVRRLFAEADPAGAGVVWTPDLAGDTLPPGDTPGRLSPELQLPTETLDRTWLLAEAILKIFSGELRHYREATLAHMRTAEQKWSAYLECVTTQQMPWEAFLNGVLAPAGTLASPPAWHWVLFHPILAVEIGSRDLGADFGADNATVRGAVALPIIGWKRYVYRRGRYDESWGLSALTSIHRDSGALGYGALVELGSIVDLGYVGRREGGVTRGSLVISLDLYSKLGQVQASLAADPLGFLDEAFTLLGGQP